MLVQLEDPQVEKVQRYCKIGTSKELFIKQALKLLFELYFD